MATDEVGLVQHKLAGMQQDMALVEEAAAAAESRRQQPRQARGHLGKTANGE